MEFWAIAPVVRGLLVLVGFGSLCTWQYAPNSTSLILLQSGFGRPTTIFVGLRTSETPFAARTLFRSFTDYFASATIMIARSLLYGMPCTVDRIPSFRVRIERSISPTCSSAAAMLSLVGRTPSRIQGNSLSL